MGIEYLDSLVGQLATLFVGKSKDEIFYAVGGILTALGEAESGSKYQQSALTNIIADTYELPGLSSGEKELRAEPYKPIAR
jgi:hypothetical protein